MSNLIHSRCPECGGAAKYLGRIESRSSNDSSSDSDDNSSSDSDDDDGPALTPSEVLSKIKAEKDTWSSEKKAKLSSMLLSLDWSEWPLAEECYDELNS